MSNRRWRVVTGDKIQWLADQDGFLVGIRDKHGNEFLLPLASAPAGLPDAPVTHSLSEAFGVAQHLTATATVTLDELAGWMCTVAAGNITIHYGNSTAGQILLPTTALALGPMPIMGPGTNGRMPIPGGQVHVVLSNASARVSIIPGI
jgi:hypothetical protein